MRMEHIYAIGDIHGCMDKLSELMEKIDIDRDSDLLVFLGDYIDRGPDSGKVVQYLIDLKPFVRKIVFLKGNHEEMLEQFLAGPDKATFLSNGGYATIKSYMIKNISDTLRIPRAHLDFLSSLLLFYETDDYIFVHAGLRENTPLNRQKEDDLLWIRRKFIYSNHDFGKRVIFGHTPFFEPHVASNKIGIDTGAVYGNKLTCVKLPEVEFFSV